jgi:hypothetical protein
LNLRPSGYEREDRASLPVDFAAAAHAELFRERFVGERSNPKDWSVENLLHGLQGPVKIKGHNVLLSYGELRATALRARTTIDRAGAK